MSTLYDILNAHADYRNINIPKYQMIAMFYVNIKHSRPIYP